PLRSEIHTLSLHDALPISAGQTVSRKRVERVMRQHGIQARVPRRYRVCTTDSKHSLPVAANLLEQNFVADRPDQVWLADITYIPDRKSTRLNSSHLGISYA